MNTIIEFVNDNEYDFDFDYEAVLKKVVEATLEHHGMEEDISLSISIVDGDTIKSINNETRDIDRVTDVLSFPNIPFSAPGDLSILEDDNVINQCIDIDSDTLYLGDVIICYERAKEQSVEYGHSFKREIAFLTVHSILHLLGYDHMTDDEREMMEEKQRYILDNLGITRE